MLGALNKVDFFKNASGGIDLENDRLRALRKELAELIGTDEKEIYHVSGKTGIGVEELLAGIIEKVPPPTEIGTIPARALVFDSFYDDHKGVVASIRMRNGSINGEQDVYLVATNTVSKIKEIGHFTPQLRALAAPGTITAGEIGYIATGIRDPEKIRIGDTVLLADARKNADKLVLPGYKEAMSVVFVSFYPEENDDYELLAKGLQKLKLNDSALHSEPDQNEALG